MKTAILWNHKLQNLFPDTEPSIKQKPENTWVTRHAREHYGGGSSASYSLQLTATGKWKLERLAYRKVESLVICQVPVLELGLILLDMCIDADKQLHEALAQQNYPWELITDLYDQAKDRYYGQRSTAQA